MKGVDIFHILISWKYSTTRPFSTKKQGHNKSYWPCLKKSHQLDKKLLNHINYKLKLPDGQKMIFKCCSQSNCNFFMQLCFPLGGEPRWSQGYSFFHLGIHPIQPFSMQPCFLEESESKLCGWEEKGCAQLFNLKVPFCLHPGLVIDLCEGHS